VPSQGFARIVICADCKYEQPIQRLPRYELLFSDLARLTPICDDLEAYTLLTGLLAQLHQTCQSMNAAKDNPLRTRRLETAWLLSDRLTFAQNQVPKAVFLQLLGSVELCGCLHVAYRSKGEFMKGLYVICVLFETTLLLATASEDGARYAVLAGISLAGATLEESDNGKGLQCHTAPHTWKMVFEHTARVYEIILTACSALEAQAWRTKLSDHIDLQVQAGRNVIELHSPLIAEMSSVGKAFGKPGSFVRRSSSPVHRTATVGPTTDLSQVIIKNTLAVKDAQQDSAAASTTSLQQIPRSQSVVTPSHVQTLAPRRADRVRLEALLADVWSRELLPYPGMTVRRAEQIRGSAGNVMRKFSMASITSNFSSSKRSASATSVAGMLRKEDAPPSQPSSRRGHRVHPKLPLNELLPADFDLQDQMQAKRGGKRSALRALTMTMERPFSPLLSCESRMGGNGLKRAHSVREDCGGGKRPPLKDVRFGQQANGAVPAQVTPPVNKIQRTKTPVQLAASPPQPKIAGVAMRTPKKSKSKRLLQLLGH
jgi:hypothetical protein